MTDVVFEQLINRRNRSVDVLFRALIVATIIALALSSVIIGVYGLMLAAILGFVAYYLIFPRFSVEYEYTLINKDLDIDIIYKKESRKTGLHLDLTQVEMIAPLSSSHIASYHGLKQVDYSAGDPANPPYAIIISHNQKMLCVLVQMSDELYRHLKMTVPRVLHAD